jgi:hypothetical protein
MTGETYTGPVDSTTYDAGRQPRSEASFSRCTMGLFNSIYEDLVGPSCGTTSKVEIQFRFGNTRLNAYQIGDTIKWSRSDVGQPHLSKVAALGTTHCPNDKCRHGEYPNPDWNVAVLIRDDVIVSIDQEAQRYVFDSGDGDYAVIEAGI